MNKFPRIVVTKTKVILLGLIALITFGAIKVDQWTEGPTTPQGCPAPKPGGGPNQNSILSTLYSLLPWTQRGGTVNDASCLNETAVHGVLQITTEADIKNALRYASDEGVTVSMAGVRHSMGGHAFKDKGLVLDMREFNAITINEEDMTMTVQSGATWHDIQKKLHPKYAVAAMQSTDIFTVGGSISVNAHGMDHQIGAVENSLVSIRIMLPDGTITTASRTENAELYEAVVGGYGLIGVIIDATIRFVPNDIYSSKRVVMPFSEFPTYFKNEIEQNKNVGLMYTHLSTAPLSLLDEAIVYVYEKSAEAVPAEEIPPLQEVSSVKLRRFIMSMSKQGAAAQQLRWWAEKYLEPKIESCSISRANAIGSGEACFVARNEPMHDSVPYLYNNMQRETDILHEYFIPRQNIVAYIEGLRQIVRERDINLLNTSIRVVHKEHGLLTYAPEEAFSAVLFINQPISEEANAKMKADTKALIDLAHTHGGRFFLPYQRYYTPAQLASSYPNLPKFLAAKKRYDPNGLLSSSFYEYITTN